MRAASGWRSCGLAISSVFIPGETIPIDGRVAKGCALVRETEISGESFTTSRSEGDNVSSGAIVLDATLDVSAVTSGSARRVDRIRTALESLKERPAPAQILANQLCGGLYPRWFCPVPRRPRSGIFTRGSTLALFNTMAMLLVACPCALGFATPVSVWCAMSRLNKPGFLLKNGAAIEKLASIDTVVFDKTGTLTVPGSFSIHLDLSAGFKEQEVWSEN